MARRHASALLFAAGVAAIAIAVLAVYWPYLNDFFALDDYIWLKEASSPSAADYFRRAFSFPTASYFDPQTPFWRPLIDAYFYFGWRVFGLNALPYHIVNVALHVAIATLTAVLVWQLSSSKRAGCLAGLLFAVLPTYNYAVTWISSATELFGGFFYVLTLVLFAAYLRGSGPRRWLYGASLATLLLALLSKESAVTVPAALGGVALLVRPPRTLHDVRRAVLELAPFAALAIAYFIFIYSQEYSEASSQSQYQFGWHVRTNLWNYLQWLTFPVPNVRAAWVIDVKPYMASAFLTLGAISIALRSPRAAFAFAWTIVALLPYSFFRLGLEYRYTYLACVPFVMFLAFFVQDVGARLRQPAQTYASVGVILAVFALCGFLATETRDRQTGLSFQGDAYRQAYEEVPALCGELPREASIFMIYDPVYDLFNTSLRMALNLKYDHVYVYRGEPPELIAFVPNVCLLDYVDGRFVLVDKH